MRAKPKGQRLFRSAWLEKGTHVPFWLPIAVWGPVVALLLARSLGAEDAPSPSVVAFLLLLGGVVWTLAEYGLHRFVFHAEPRSSAGRRLVFLTHGIHHAEPDVGTRLLMPPLAAIPLALAFYFFFGLFIEGARLHAFFAGFLLGYLVYDYTHYALHHSEIAQRLFGSRWAGLKRHHMLHHYAEPDRAYGVSTAIWDWTFRTLPRSRRFNRGGASAGGRGDVPSRASGWSAPSTR